MARKRYQKGHVYLDGDKWKGRYREDLIACGEAVRIRREVILGSKRELPTKRLAERRMEVVLARVNGLHYCPARVATFGEFIERWKIEVLSKQKPSSVRAVRSHLKCHILPELARLRLEEFGVENQQIFITRVSGKGVSRKTTLNVLGTLSSYLRARKTDHPDYIFELKHDGFRAVAYIEDGECKIVSRNMKTLRFQSLSKDLAKLRVRSAIIDGEIVCLDTNGVSQFNSLLKE